MRFDDVEKGFEMGLIPLKEGQLGLTQVGKNIGTAVQVQKTVNIFGQALNNPVFRSELLIRLKASQEYLIDAYKAGSRSQTAIDRAHDIHYIIQAIKK